jgi:hypothetical protein
MLAVNHHAAQMATSEKICHGMLRVDPNSVTWHKRGCSGTPDDIAGRSGKQAAAVVPNGRLAILQEHEKSPQILRQASLS